MKILIVEDQPVKRDQIKSFVIKEIDDVVEIVDKESLRGALKEISTCDDYDLILLDMSMPNFDPSEDVSLGGSPESFAGKELLEQMKLRDIVIPVIVITQYSSFEGGAVTLGSLSDEFSSKYKEVYRGSVYFDSAVESWKGQLLDLLRDINE